MSAEPSLPQDLRESLLKWLDQWGAESLHDRLVLRTSARFSTSLGRYRADRSEITLASWLLEGPSHLADEVLCHEAAHAAVHAIFGPKARPHGAEWRGLMREAGFNPRVRVPASDLPMEIRRKARARGLWEHRCPVCQATRYARTRVGRWRCRSCRDEGRDGRLVVRRASPTVGIDP